MDMNLETNTENRKSTSAILILLIVTLTAASASICMNKVSPIMPILMNNLKFREAQGGLLISVFSIIGIFLAIPGGVVIQKLGIWKSGIIGLIALILGSLLGTYSSSFTPLLITRVIEGVGMALLSIVGPVVIGMTFSPEKRGGAMGIFTTYSTLGQFAMLILAPHLAEDYGWRGVWWFATIYTIIFFIIWVLVMRRIDACNSSHEHVEEKSQINSNTRIAPSTLKNKSVWLLTITLCLFAVALMSVLFFLPTYLNLVRGMSMSSASGMVSIAAILGIPCAMIGGALSDKIGSRRWFSIIFIVISAVSFGIIPLIPTNKMIFIIIALGVFPCMVLPPIFTAVTEVLEDQRMAGLAMGLLSTGQNLGFALSSAIFGAIVQSVSWNVAFYVLVPITILSGVSMIFNKKVK